MSETSVRGAGRARAGATDTTMLIWKVIAANPGITRQEIWEQVEHSIPEGYARRMYAKTGIAPRGVRSTTDPSVVDLRRARGYVLTFTLAHMRHGGRNAKPLVAWDGEGNNRRYTAIREPWYCGNSGVIDASGTKAAEHMAVADALRTAEKWLARAKPDRVDSLGRRSVPVLGPPSRKEYEALTLVVKALRAKGSSEG